jgi:small GTP-binding protein
MVSNSFDLIYKVLLLGDTSVGKTCFLLRYTEDTFTENHISTIGVDFKLKLLSTAPEKNIKLQIWDTAGQDRFRCITKSYFRGSHGILLIYDITSTSSFNNIKNWILQIRESLGEQPCITLVGNKVDLESNRRVSREDGIRLAKEYEMSFFETSAKDDTNISEAFNQLTKEMVAKGDGKKEDRALRRRRNNWYDCCPH